MRDSGLDSISPNLVKSTFGHGNRPSAAPESPLLAAAAAGGAVITPLTKLCTSSSSTRFLGPVALMRPRSTPSSRANLRMDGEACALLKLASSMAPVAAGAGAAAATTDGAGAAAATAVGAADGAAVGVGADAGAGAGAGAGASAGAGAAPASKATTMTTAPLDTLSPSLILISLTTPATVDGTSIVALSDSRVTSDCSTFTVSPTLTRISMTGISVKSPISGTSTSTLPPPADGATAATEGAAGPAAATGTPATGAGADAAAGAGAGAAVVAAAAAATSITATTVPMLHLSPSLTRSSLITPATSAGTSIVALSDSRVTMDCSLATVSPTFTRISITGMSVKSPISGTLSSCEDIIFPAPYTVVGLGLFGSMPYFVMASASSLRSITPSSAKALKAASVT